MRLDDWQRGRLWRTCSRDGRLRLKHRLVGIVYRRRGRRWLRGLTLGRRCESLGLNEILQILEALPHHSHLRFKLAHLLCRRDGLTQRFGPLPIVARVVHCIRHAIGGARLAARARCASVHAHRCALERRELRLGGCLTVAVSDWRAVFDSRARAVRKRRAGVLLRRQRGGLDHVVRRCRALRKARIRLPFFRRRCLLLVLWGRLARSRRRVLLRFAAPRRPQPILCCLGALPLLVCVIRAGPLRLRLLLPVAALLLMNELAPACELLLFLWGWLLWLALHCQPAALMHHLLQHFEGADCAIYHRARCEIEHCDVRPAGAAIRGAWPRRVPASPPNAHARVALLGERLAAAREAHRAAAWQHGGVAHGAAAQRAEQRVRQARRNGGVVRQRRRAQAEPRAQRERHAPLKPRRLQPGRLGRLPSPRPAERARPRGGARRRRRLRRAHPSRGALRVGGCAGEGPGGRGRGGEGSPGAAPALWRRPRARARAKAPRIRNSKPRFPARGSRDVFWVPPRVLWMNPGRERLLGPSMCD